jgi:hypothetical protein
MMAAGTLQCDDVACSPWNSTAALAHPNSNSSCYLDGKNLNPAEHSRQAPFLD